MVVAANGEVLTKEEATVHVRETDLFLKVMLLENTPAVLSLGKLCETLPVLLIYYLWSCEQKWYRVSTTFYSLPERRKLRHLFEENNKGFLQRTPRYSRAQNGKNGDLMTADHKVLSGGCESRQSSTRCRGTRLGYTMDTIQPVQNENFSGNIEELAEVPGADHETKSDLH